MSEVKKELLQYFICGPELRFRSLVQLMVVGNHTQVDAASLHHFSRVRLAHAVT